MKYASGNERSTSATKLVMFDMMVGVDIADEDLRVANSSYSTSNYSTRLQTMVRSLSLELIGVWHEQKYLLASNQVHLSISEKTNTVVAQWALFQLVTVTAATAFQIWYIKSFFEDKWIL